MRIGLLMLVVTAGNIVADENLVKFGEAKTKGRVAVTLTRSKDRSDILILDLEKKTATVAVADYGRSEGPAWHPRNEELAFHSNQLGRNQLFTVVLGEKPRQRLESKSLDQNPDWSPDGKKIVFQRERSTKNGTSILVLDLETDEIWPPLLDTQMNAVPRWAPDGKSILFSRRSYRPSSWRLMTLDAKSAEMKQFSVLEESCVRGAFSADGLKVAFAAEVKDKKDSINIFLQKEEKTNRLTEYDGKDLDPVWLSADEIIFVRETTPGKGDFALMLLNLKSRSLSTLANAGKLGLRHPAVKAVQ